jgi:hypothetical protein
METKRLRIAVNSVFCIYRCSGIQYQLNIRNIAYKTSMTVRFAIPGSDNGSKGYILSGFLDTFINSDGSFKRGIVSR